MFDFLLPTLNKVVKISKHFFFRHVVKLPEITGNRAIIEELGDVLFKIMATAGGLGYRLKPGIAPVVERTGGPNGQSIIILPTGYKIIVFRVQQTETLPMRWVTHFPAVTFPLSEINIFLAGHAAALKELQDIR